MVLNGNAADIGKHCVPGVPAKRYGIFLLVTKIESMLLRRTCKNEDDPYISQL